MKTIRFEAIAAVLVLFAGTTEAIDRDAAMIDTIAIVGSPFDSSDMVSVSLWGETAVRQATDWAFLVGGQYGRVSPHRIDDLGDFWGVGVGIKWYLTPVTAVSVLGEYGQYADVVGTPEVRTGTVTLKQRLLPADQPMSPFLEAAAGLRSSDAILDFEGREFRFEDSESSEVVVTLGGGCDFAMTDDMVIVVEAAYSEGDGLADGWLGTLGMAYYWDR